MSSPHPDMSSRSETQQDEQKEEMNKTLTLPNDEEMSKAGNKLVKQVKKEKMKNAKKINSSTVRKQTPGRHELKMAMMKRENMPKDSKHDLIALERQKALLELYMMRKKNEISKMDKTIEKEEARLKQLEKLLDEENHRFEEFLRENEKKSLEARTFFEQEAMSKQQKNAEIKKLTSEIVTLKSELAKFEETLTDYKRYKELLFKLSPLEWQEAQRTKAMKAKVLSDNGQNKQNTELAVSPIRDGLDDGVPVQGGEVTSIRETEHSSTHSDTLIKTCKPDSDSSDFEEEPELYFTDPQQLLDLVSELTDQNLSLFHISTRVAETLKELRQTMETTKKNLENDEEPIQMQISDMNRRIDKEKARGAQLKQKVQLLGSLNTEDQDVMLEALDQKVAEVHHCCVDGRLTNVSTLEKLANIENCMCLLLQSLESIPEDSLKMLKKIMDKERRSREREEKLREQRKKQEERMKRYLERSLTDSKKITGKKVMPRSMPVAHKVRVRKVDTSPAEDDMHAYLYTSDDIN